MKEYFRSEKISEHMTRIYLPGDVYAYLVEGTDKTVLIDTGCGVGDLRTYVDSLTKKPLTVLLTHGHLDHAPGTVQFDEVYMNSADQDIYVDHDSLHQRISYLETTSSAGKYNREDLLPENKTASFHELTDGMRFGLGEIHITAYSCPGHTPGSMTFLMEEERALLLGDACNPFTFLFDETSLGVSSYEKALKRLSEKVEGKYDRVLLSHSAGNTPSRNMIQDNIEVCEAIKKGQVDGAPYEFMDRKAAIAFKEQRLNEYEEIKANIVYHPDRIKE